MYEYYATYVRTIDGDTIVVDLDLGFSTWIRNASLRLLGVDTPELNSPDSAVREKAVAAREFTAATMAKNPRVVVRTERTRSGGEVRTFTRYVASVQITKDHVGNPASISDLSTWIVLCGHGVAA